MSSIWEYLIQKRSQNMRYTHVSMAIKKDKYTIGNCHLKEFWDLYQDFVYDKEGVIGIAERTINYPYLPVVGDIDIKLDIDKMIKSHSEHHVIDTVKIFQNVLKKFVKDVDPKHLYCFVLKRNPYKTEDGKYIKHGFHLHFPYTFISKKDQETYIMSSIKTEMKNSMIFKDIGIDDSSNVVDNWFNKPWLLYGSTKNKNIEPYKIEFIYNDKMDTILIEEALKGYRIYDEDDDLIDIEHEYEYHLPRILSVNPYNRPLCEINNIDVKVSLQTKKIALNVKKRKNYKPCNIEEVKQVVDLIDISRSEDYDSWMTIGFCLFNVSNGSEEGFDIWNDFSKQSSKYDHGDCIRKWNNMTIKNMTMGTLMYYAHLDNPDKLIQYKKKKAKNNIEKCLGGANSDIALLLYNMYKDQFVCSSILNHSWYEWKQNKWERIEKGTYLRKKISNEVVDIFIEKGQDLYAQMSKADKAETAMLNEKNKMVNKIISNCKSASFKNRVMEECAEQFYDDSFRNKLDVNPMLFPFKNGVYDLSTDTFRIARPDDYISKTAPVEYDVKLTMSSPSVKDVLTHLEKVFPDESVRTYFMDVSSDIFEGGNMRKHGYFWTGHGNNGKSVTQNLFEEILGPYGIVLPTTIITGKKVANGSANPELARAGGGVRLVTVEEPSKEEPINNGTYKNLTGNDKFFARDLYERGRESREINPMFKFIVICNKLPKFRDPNDGGIWVRARVIPFESKFTRPGEHVPSTYEEQLKEKRFPMDPNFKKKIPGMAKAFAWLLIQHRKKIKDKIVIEPSKVLQATNEYKRQSDIYRQFEEEKIEEEENIPVQKQNILSLTELYSQFKDWFRDSLPNHTVPTKNEVKDHFVLLWNNKLLKGTRWRGFKIRNDYFNDDNDEQPSNPQNMIDIL